VTSVEGYRGAARVERLKMAASKGGGFEQEITEGKEGEFAIYDRRLEEVP
jgi:hypothetical protein